LPFGIDHREGVNRNMWTKLNSLVLSLYARAQLQREEGQALVEYVLILSLIVVLSIALLTTLGKDVEGALKTVTEKF
jgi:Flp pilus assembly pilin Flp